MRCAFRLCVLHSHIFLFSSRVHVLKFETKAIHRLYIGVYSAHVKQTDPLQIQTEALFFCRMQLALGVRIVAVNNLLTHAFAVHAQHKWHIANKPSVVEI